MEGNITNFSQGEISPLYYGRIDTKFYASSAKEIKNMLITPSGSLNKRPGTKFSGTHRYTDRNVRLIPLTVGLTKYLLEFGDGYFRIHKDGTVIRDGVGDIVEFVTPWNIAATSSLNYVELDDQLIITHNTTEPRIIYNTGSDEGWGIKTIDWYAIDSSELAPPTVLSPTEMRGTISVSYNRFSFASSDVGQRLYLRTSTKSGYFTMNEYVWTKYQAKTVTNEDDSDTTREVDVEVPENKMIGVYTPITGDAIVAGDEILEYAVQPGDMSAIRPGNVASVDSRLILSGFSNSPRRIIGSNVGKPFVFRMGFDASFSYDFVIKDNFGTKIQWISGLRSFVIATDEGIFTIGNNETITPVSAFQLVRQTAHRCENIKPVLAGDYLIFVQSPGTQLRILQYNFEKDTYLSPSLSGKAEHLFRDGIKQIAYQQAPVNVVYAVLNNGKLAAFVLDPENGVSGWSIFETDGEINAISVVPGTDGEDDVYLSVRRITNGYTYYHLEKLEYYRMDRFDDAWYVDSGVEWIGADIACAHLSDDGLIIFDSAGMSIGDVIQFEEEPEGCNNLEGRYLKLYSQNSSTEFVLSDLSDNLLSGIGESTSTFIVKETSNSISVPDHYHDGVEISVFTESGFYTDIAVSGGSITIPTFCRLIRAGFPFTSRVTTLPVPVRIKNVKEVYEVGVMFFESHAGSLRDEDGDLSSNFTMDDDIVLDQAAKLWTGVKRLHFNAGQSKYGNITIESAQPTPMNILAITYEVAEA